MSTAIEGAMAGKGAPSPAIRATIQAAQLAGVPPMHFAYALNLCKDPDLRRVAVAARHRLWRRLAKRYAFRSIARWFDVAPSTVSRACRD